MRKCIVGVAMAVAALVFSVECRGQAVFKSGDQYKITAITTTNSVGALATNAPLSVLNVRGVRDIGLQFRGVLTNGETANVVLTLSRSLDGTNYVTAGGVVWTIPMTGTTTNYAITNFTIAVPGYLRLESIVNAATNSPVNAVQVLGINKLGSP